MRRSIATTQAAALALAMAAIWLGGTGRCPAASEEARLSVSVVKIYATIQPRDYSLPWQSLPAMQASGSGFIVGKRRILTNAHMVSDARFIQVQKNQDAKLHVARVSFVAHDCDLAVLEVDDESFFDNTKPAPFSRTLPQLNDQVTVLGYPVGGTKLSVTRGVVSRIDYSGYSHSGVDQHLILQVDAAINPGNSGGPVFFNGKVVGMAFQGLSQAENIGYAIPMPVITRFIEDIADGKYDGYPELGVRGMPVHNAALRNDLKMLPWHSGIAVFYVDPYGAGFTHIQAGDVLMAIDGHPIRDDGTVMLDNTSVLFAELLERKQRGDSVTFQVLRDGAEKQVVVPLTNPQDPFSYRNNYDEQPRYLIVGGLVFSPLTQEYIRALGDDVGTPGGQQLLYYSEYAKIDGLCTNRDEFVILATMLPHPVNTHKQTFVRGIVSTVNDQPVRSLSDIKKAIASPLDGFHVIRFDGMDHVLVLDADTTEEANPLILKRYGVSSPEYLPLRPEGAAYEK